MSSWWLLPRGGRGGGTPSPCSSQAVLSPQVSGVVALDQAAIARFMDRMRLRGEASLPDVVHALHVFGSSVEVEPSPDAAPLRALDLVLDADRGATFFGSKPLGVTRHGARYPVHIATQSELKQGGAEAHRGQTLSVLAAAGVGLDHPVRLPGGARATLRAVLDDLVANYSPGGELYWEAVSFSLLLPPKRQWTNKLSETFTFDHIANELLRRPPGGSACGGVHRLHSLAVILRADDQMPILSPAVREGMRGHLAHVARVLTACQETDGAWTLDWHVALAGGTPVGTDAATDKAWATWSRVIATGHHLEWLMLMPEGVRPPRRTFAAGATWLHAALAQVLGSPAEARKYYCPASHAVRALRILSLAEGSELRVASPTDVGRAGLGGPPMSGDPERSVTARISTTQTQPQ